MARPKLLLADDSVTIRKVVELTFADEGIDVSTAADAETAMQKFNEVQPDIVLVDISLPGTSGYQICEMIKQDEATKHIPVLLLVGSFEPFDHDEAERAGADGFLTKPFHSIRDLVGRVWDLLGRDGSVEKVTAEEVPVEAEQQAEDAPEMEMPVEEVPIAGEGVPAASEVADIEHLYDSSFANTAEIEEFDTVDDLLGDPGMDDELIEARGGADNGLDTQFRNVDVDNEPAATKEFDWSPDALIVDNEPPGDDQPAVNEEYDDISLHETVADDPTGGEWRPSEGPIIVEPAAQPQEGDISLHETVADDPTSGEWRPRERTMSVEPAAQPEEDDISLHVTVADDPTGGEWRAEETSSKTVEPAAQVVAVEDSGTPVQHENVSEHEYVEKQTDEVNYDEVRTVEEAPPADDIDGERDESIDVPPYVTNSPFTETVETNDAEIVPPVPDEPPPVVRQTNEPSPEMIALIAQRVIDHLSDSVVRDIAMEAVPRIAEKLMREALDKESKS